MKITNTTIGNYSLGHNENDMKRTLYNILNRVCLNLMNFVMQRSDENIIYMDACNDIKSFFFVFFFSLLMMNEVGTYSYYALINIIVARFKIR